MTRCTAFFFVVAVCLVATEPRRSAASEADADVEVSFFRDVRPIFQAHCQGCHQPAKASGAYVMTSSDALRTSGDSEEPPIVPGEPDDSFLIALITPDDGEASMPQDGPPLSDRQIEIIRQWIAAGAVDDTPASNRARIDAEHPPVYTRPPVITSLDYSPDGKLLAIAGFHETLLHRADGSGLVARLIGMSQRVESVRFSPDGTRLAVTGGSPAQMGEVQIWDVGSQELLLSVPITFDTVYGASWSPDGKLLALGCTDNTVRAIEVDTGKQVLYQGAHSDWVFGTVFSVDGSHLVSVGRDASAKLIEVPHQRFVDNVTSITPGALRGGINAIARHPLRDEILFGGADGMPKIYRMHRATKRVIGDDANLLWELPKLPGRIFSVDYSLDGRLIAAGSSLDGSGTVALFGIDPEPKIPDEINAILVKPTHSRNDKEREQLARYFEAGINELARVSVETGGIYTVAISPDASRVAAAGADGQIRVLDATNGEVVTKFLPVVLADTVAETKQLVALTKATTREFPKTDFSSEKQPDRADVARLRALPAAIQLASAIDYVQLIVIAELESGEVIDVTRMVEYQLESPIARVSPTGVVSATADGATKLSVALGSQTVAIPIEVAGVADVLKPDYLRDVSPILARAGCNAGTCHGAQDGKNGFKLSLRGYDPIYDLRALSDDAASRRINRASSADSLMLLKPTAAVPHEGGQVLDPNSNYYRTLLAWIEAGASLDMESARVARLEVQPVNPIVQAIGARQQLRVVAKYTDGSQRDVTREAFIESGEAEVANLVEEAPGLIEVVRRGEAPILVRYEGAYAATTITVMGDRSGYTWQDPPTNNRIDELVHEKLKRTKTSISSVCDDYTFLRRIYLDLTGLPPTPEQIQEFIDNPNDSRWKRDQLIDQLIGNHEYVEHWSNKWADLLQVNSKFLGREGAEALRQWIHEQVKANMPYDKFARAVLTATGSTKENPAASYYKILREPDITMENTTHLFLATRFNCNKCHDHPFERWTQDQYYQLAAYFSQIGFKKDPASGDKNIAGTAVESARPLYEVVFEKSEGEMTHQRTGAVAEPKFPFECQHDCDPNASRQDQLAAWITSPDNPYFAKSYTNRIWAYLTGRGFIEPIDDIRAGNPPTNPELLQWLTAEFVENGFDTQHLVRTICRSRTYQLALTTDRFNEDDDLNYSHARARRLPAEVLYDAIYLTTGAKSKIPGVAQGTRAAALPDVGIKLSDGFLNNLGRPARESACECERSNELQMGPVMALINGATVGNAVGDSDGALVQLVQSIKNDRQLLKKLFLRILGRPASDDEVSDLMQVISEIERSHELTVAKLEAYETELRPVLEQREKERKAKLEQTKVALAEHKRQAAPERERLTREREEQIAAAEKALQEVRLALIKKLPAWEEAQRSTTVWEPWNPIEVHSTTGAQTKVLEDQTVKVEGRNGQKSTNHIVAPVDLTGITGLKIDALSDKKLPKGGPGRADDGNFVLTELKFETSQPLAIASPLIEVWDFADSAEDWTSLQGTVFNVQEGSALVEHKQQKQSLVVNVDAPAKPLVLEVTAKIDASMTLGVRWKAIDHSEFDDARAVRRQVHRGNTRWRTYQLYFHPKSPVKSLQLEVFDGGDKVSIDSIRLIQAASPKYEEVKLQLAQAVFHQEGFPAEEAIDGKLDGDDNGWAIAPQFGKDHAAIFQTPQEAAVVGRGLARVQLIHNYSSGKHNLGLFRVSLTRSPRPISFGIPKSISDVLAIRLKDRTKEQQERIVEYYLAGRDEVVKQQQLVTQASKPLPLDKVVQQYEAKIAELSKPLPEDPKLVRLRRAAKLSEQQLADKRLTVAQDVAWALINSPEFLYNH